MKNFFKNILNILILLIPIIDYGIDTKYFLFRFSYPIYLIYLISYSNIIIENKFFLKDISKFSYLIISIIFISSITNIYLGYNTIILFLKQLIIIPFVALSIRTFFYNNRNNFNSITNSYIIISIILAYFGLLQEISYLVGFETGYNYGINQIGTSKFMFRVTTICAEPSVLVYALLPAFYISLTSLLTNKFVLLKHYNAIAIIVCMCLTYSTLAYIGILLSFLLICMWNIKIIKIKNTLCFIFIFLSLLYLGFDQIYIRIYQTIFPNNIETEQIETNDMKSSILNLKFKHINTSSYQLIWHFRNAFESFKSHPIFGTGLGSYFEIFKKYGDKFHYDKVIETLHTKDGASLFIRILGELGIFGLLILAYFILKNHINIYSYQNNSLNYWVILNNAILVYILIRSIRCGVYHCDGAFFFYYIYIYSKKMFHYELLKK